MRAPRKLTKRLKFLTVIVAGLAATLAYTGSLCAAGPSAAGLWDQSDENGHSWFLIFEHDGVYEGAIAKMYFKPGEDPHPICTNCSGEQKNAPALGLTIIKGMHRNGLMYENGTILDPRNGLVYGAKMQVSPDGQRLTLRGYLGIELFGQNQVWKRLPDDALSPNEVPPNLVPYWEALLRQSDRKMTNGGSPPKNSGPKSMQPMH
jgi:Uncharacterized protein conserved in bacteria (DUF2147)